MKAACQLISKAQHIYAVTHMDPDGDAIGSLLGLGWGLRALGKTPVLACADPVPMPFDFLPGSQDIVRTKPQQPDLIIALDAGDIPRLGGLYDPQREAGIPLLVIDHHVTNQGFGDVNIIRPTVASTSELILELLKALGVSLTPQIATCLLTGLITDTRSFMTGNTTPDTFRAAIELLDAGAPLHEITRNVFDSKPVAYLRLLGRALCDLHLEGRIVWTQITQATLKEVGADGLDGGGSIVNVLSGTRDADVAVVFREQPDGRIDIGMRSSPAVNLAPIAVSLGGGGHPQAAGALLEGPLEKARERVLSALRAALANGSGPDAGEAKG